MIYRLYFNRCEDFPQIWSIDEGDISTEVNVSGFGLGPGVGARDGCAPDFAAIDVVREPKAWVVIEADRVLVERGVALFRRDS